MASGLKRVGDLDINQDLDFQGRCWAVQRIGWIVMALLVLSALLGLFGRGLFSHTLISDPSIPLSVEYERFGRYQSPLSLRLHVDPFPSGDGKMRLWFSRDFLRDVQIQSIAPPPDRVELSPNGTIYLFGLAQPSQGGEVTVHFEAQTIGPLRGKVGLTDSPAIAFTQWIYP
ncbi:MAG TPA: hypothetical protein VL329_01725 [Nitrospiraceae bacterium]|nr:hypothetical protein [Nitrospiraceae bacterium]